MHIAGCHEVQPPVDVHSGSSLTSKTCWTNLRLNGVPDDPVVDLMTTSHMTAHEQYITSIEDDAAGPQDSQHSVDRRGIFLLQSNIAGLVPLVKITQGLRARPGSTW